MKGDITKIYGVDLVGSYDPNDLVRTDSAVGLNITVGTTEITSDFDSCYPWSDIEEVTDEFGNVFIKIPKFYSKITKNADGTYKHQLSGTKHEGFDTLFKVGTKEIDYVMVGKYEGSGSIERVYSKRIQTVLTRITCDNFRTACKANGAGYQQYDFLIDLIIKELWLVEMKTTNCQSIMAGYTKGNPGRTHTGTTDSVSTPSGSPESNTDSKHSCKYRGIENLWGNTETWCDGVSFSFEKVYVCTDPASYAAGKTDSPYIYKGDRPKAEGFIKKVEPLGQNSLIQYCTGVVGSSTTYFCDESIYYQPSSNSVLTVGGSFSSGGRAGLWCWNGSRNASSTNAPIGGRLCYKPEPSLPQTFNPQRNKIVCSIGRLSDISSTQQVCYGLAQFKLPNPKQEAFYLQPESWADSKTKTGDLTNDGNAELEYLNYPHPFDALTGEELVQYDNIHDSINTYQQRLIGECCLQPVGEQGPQSQYNVWTDLKRIQINTPAGPRVVQTQEAAKWDDTKFWVEGWDEETDTHMAQVKRHPQLTNKTLNIDCYMQNIDDLYTSLETCTLSYENGTDSNSGIWYLKKPDGSTYVTLKVKQTPKTGGVIDERRTK